MASEDGLRLLPVEFRREYPGTIGDREWLDCVPAGYAVRLRPSDYSILTFFGALVLLVLIASAARGLQRVLTTPHGFEFRDVVAVDPALNSRGYSKEMAQVQLAELRRRAESVPGVRGAFVCALPFCAAVIGFTGFLTLALAAMGIGGLLSYAVSQRTREIGIRVALGASPACIVRLVLAQSAGHCA
jgi:GNAT superfamily N-acetyltransferase